MLTKRCNKGFTLIELVMVIVILAILAIVAIPQFFDLSGDAEDSAEAGVIGGVRAGIATQIANNGVNGTVPVIPATLDSIVLAVTCSTTNRCFEDVIPGGVTDGSWSKAVGALGAYTGPAGGVFVYDPATGTID